MIILPLLRKLRVELGLDCPLLCLHCSAFAAPGHPLGLPTELAARISQAEKGIFEEEGEEYEDEDEDYEDEEDEDEEEPPRKPRYR